MKYFNTLVLLYWDYKTRELEVKWSEIIFSSSVNSSLCLSHSWQKLGWSPTKSLRTAALKTSLERYLSCSTFNVKLQDIIHCKPGPIVLSLSEQNWRNFTPVWCPLWSNYLFVIIMMRTLIHQPPPEWTTPVIRDQGRDHDVAIVSSLMP